ncbi:MAG: folate-binding protein [Halopseudomonas sp.]
MPHPSWIDFLNQQGVSQDSTSASAATTDQNNSTLLVPLSDQTLISAEGPDTEKYLQGQLTCDLNRLNTEQSLLGANCTPKGMVISAFRLFKPAEGQILMRLPLACADSALTNLKKFAVFSKLTLELADQQWVGIGLIGESAAECLQQLGVTPPTDINQQVLSDDLIVVRVAGATPRFELWSPLPHAEQLWQQLAKQTQLGSHQAWLAADIQAGLVQLGPESLDSYIPQMLNLQAVDGVGFDKGCYTGQEVVARLQFRGKLKKLMYAATVAVKELNEQPVSISDSLVSSNGRVVGKILSYAHQDQHLVLQAIINKTAADNNDLHLHSAEGPTVSLLPLPYSIDPELFERPER